MLNVKVKLNTFARAQKLCILASKQAFPVTLMQGLMRVNAKSILSIFSLSLMDDVIVEVPDAVGSKEFLYDITVL